MDRPSKYHQLLTTNVNKLNDSLSPTVQVEHSEKQDIKLDFGFFFIMTNKVNRQHGNNFICKQFPVTNNEYKEIYSFSVPIQANKHHPDFPTKCLQNRKL